MIYQEIQHNLEQRYDLKLPCQVMHFVSHDQGLVQQLIGDVDIPSEVLLIREELDSLDVTLFLEQALIDSTNGGNAQQQHSENFSDYCEILEGVSHFVYLVWNAQYGRQIKPVEMELQAEVDKFVLTALSDNDAVMPESCAQSGRDQLSHKLFHKVEYVHPRGSSMHQRYRTANDLAERYCRWLSRHFQFTKNNPFLYAELARFYRMNASAKFEYIKHSAR